MAEPKKLTEQEGSSAQTGLAVGGGAILGAMVLTPIVIAAAPILLPVAAATAVIGYAGLAATGVGAAIGYIFGKKT